MSLCRDCIQGVRHEGTAQGTWEVIGGIRSYVATPAGDYPKDTVILFVTDVFGPDLINAQLLADDFALNNNLKTVIPDIYNGDPIPPEALSPGASPPFDLMGWLGKHGADVTRPPLDKVIAALKEEGVTTFAGNGYCLGARYVVDLAYDHLVKVVVLNHPTLLKNPEDLEKLRDVATAPILINSCPIDTQFTLEFQAKADEILGDGKYAPGYKREYWEGCTHGFTIRGDLNDPLFKAGKEGAFKAAVEWFGAHL
jgi:dienelactone hydrolase